MSPFVEPTRRLSFSARFSYDRRYGASLVGLLLGGYLLLVTDVGALVLGLGGLAGRPAEQTATALVQFLVAVAVIVGALLIAPATQGRRIIAVVAVLILLVVWMLVVGARATGLGGPVPFFASGFVAAPAFIAALATSLGWLIVRERPGPAYALLLLTLLAGAIPFLATLNSLPAIVPLLVSPVVAGAVGIGIAWAARGVAAGVQRLHDGDGLIDQPPAG